MPQSGKPAGVVTGEAMVLGRAVVKGAKVVVGATMVPVHVHQQHISVHVETLRHANSLGANTV